MVEVTGAVRAIIFAVIGAVAGFVVGIVAFRLVATLDTATGWEDLVSVALSLFSFAPVGAMAGALLGVRRGGRSLVAGMSTHRRIGALVGTAAGVAVGTIVGVVMDDPMSALFLAVWGIAVGGLIGWLVVRILGAGEEPPVVPAA